MQQLLSLQTTKTRRDQARSEFDACKQGEDSIVQFNLKFIAKYVKVCDLGVRQGTSTTSC